MTSDCPCAHQRKECKYGTRCKLREYPVDTCVFHLQGNCKHPNTCKWKHPPKQEEQLERVLQELAEMKQQLSGTKKDKSNKPNKDKHVHEDSKRLKQRAKKAEEKVKQLETERKFEQMEHRIDTKLNELKYKTAVAVSRVAHNVELVKVEGTGHLNTLKSAVDATKAIAEAKPTVVHTPLALGYYHYGPYVGWTSYHCSACGSRRYRHSPCLHNPDTYWSSVYY